MRKELFKIVFAENQQGLTEMIIEVIWNKDRIGVILESHSESLEDIYKGSIINVDSLRRLEKLEILNFKERCSDYIPYLIEDLQAFDHFKYKVSDFEQAALKHEFTIEFREFIYIGGTNFIDSVEGIVTIGEDSERSEKNLCVEWSSDGRAILCDIRVPEFDLKL